MSQGANIEEDMTDAGKATSGPRQVKGGVFAQSDIDLIKNALAKYICFDISDAEQRQVANLLHRLNNRT